VQAVAIEAAYRLEHDFPDGCVYLENGGTAGGGERVPALASREYEVVRLLGVLVGSHEMERNIYWEVLQNRKLLIVAGYSRAEPVDYSDFEIPVPPRPSALLVYTIEKLVIDGATYVQVPPRPSGSDVTGVEVTAEADESPNAKTDEVPVRPAHEPLEYYISYAWGDDTTEGKEGEAVIDRLCSEAEGRGKRIIRDQTAMKIGDRFSIFMDRIGKRAVNGRVCIVLSDNYLRSTYCMYELFDVWRSCREDGGTFIDRTRVFVLPSAKIATDVERAQYVIYWQSKFKEMDALIREHGQFVLSDKDHAEFRLMSRFVRETANILQLVQDTLRPRSFDYVKHVFD
jgi:hypothetical protein